MVHVIKNNPDIKAAIGILNSHSNQLIREHKSRKHTPKNQVKYLNFDDHPEIMHTIISAIEGGKKSADSWFWHLPEGENNLIESFFDLMDIIKQLIEYKFNHKMVIDRKFRVKRLPQEIKDNRNWYKAIKSAMILDCDSPYRQWRTKINSSFAERTVTSTLDRKGHENQTEDDQKNNPNHNVKDGTPDNLLKKPLDICINGKLVTLYWIETKYECCCITTVHRNRLREQVIIDFVFNFLHKSQ